MGKKLNLGLFGLPGAGKGTQASRLSSHLGLPHISTGEMFRSLSRESSPLALKVKEIISSGNLVPDDLVTQMTFKRLAEPDAKAGFILDGFPRTLPQAKDLQKSIFALNALIEVRVERSEIIRRLSGRRVCPKCGAIYHIDEMKAGQNRCVIDQTQLDHRPDDSPESVVLRLDLFEQNFAPLVHFFEGQRLLWVLDGSGDPDEVFARLLRVVTEIKEVI
jgi:adenylate kinase